MKYHLGASSDREFDGNKVHLSLTANPSHLEIVDPVVLGKVRAKQDQLNDIFERAKVLPLLIHGDAAFAGQGVVAECFGLSGLRGHRTGGSLHFIVNNQIGFTTYPRYSRSSPYPSDVAKLVEAPIFHVNGDDPEAVVFCAKVAIEYRQKFHKPVVIDMFCYRRFGHNEGDEPLVHPADHVPADPLASDHAADLRRQARSRRASSRPAKSTRCAPTGAIGSTRNTKPGRPIRPTRRTGSTAAGQASRPRRMSPTTTAAARPASRSTA